MSQSVTAVAVGGALLAGALLSSQSAEPLGGLLLAGAAAAVVVSQLRRTRSTVR